jgi:hypothetical protein
MSLYVWDWSGWELRTAPAVPPQGRRILGTLDIADVDDEAAQGLGYSGVDSGRTLATRHRLARGGPLVPEAGRKVATLRLAVLPKGTRRLLLRASFDGDGLLRVSGPGAAETAVPAHSSDPEVYSEILLPLAGDARAPLTIDFVAPSGTSGSARRDFAVYRIWFLD